jgi:hypothetical protein
MPDSGHPITFGLSLYPSVDQLGETRQLAQAADAGLDYLPIQDHAYKPRVPRRVDAHQLPSGRDRPHHVLSYLIPIVALILGWIWLGERPPILAMCGGALCMAGVYLARRPPAQSLDG